MEQVLFEQHARLVTRVTRVVGYPARRAIELFTLLIALASGISLLIFHAIYITNSSNSHINCLMTYYDAHNISKPSTSIREYDIIKLSIIRAEDHPSGEFGECSASYKSCEGEDVTTSKVNNNDNVYLFSLDRGAMMLADETMQYHNFTMLEINFPSSASCFGPPLTSRILRDYLGYDLIVLNWAVAAFEGEGFMYKVDRRELFNLHHAGDFVSKKGVSLIDEKRSVRYKDPLVLPTLVLESLSNLGIGEKGMAVFNMLTEKSHALWVAMDENKFLHPVTAQIKWIFADEFATTSSTGNTVNSFLNLMYSAVRIGNSRWAYITQSAPLLNQYIIFRFGVLFSTTFLFFVTTTLVSYTLRETQERMLRFTHQLQHCIRHDLPYWQLVFSHLVESLVFVPIIVGIHFFLVEFFSDQLLAFMVLLMVWMGEVFSVLSLRSKASIRYFPKLFSCYFFLFHVYFFSFPYGFSYLAWLTAMLFQLHATMHLMNHYEIPAFEQGIVNARNPRLGLVDVAALARAEEAAAVRAAQIAPQSNGAVFRRMQALRRAAQLAEALGTDTPHRKARARDGGRNRSSTSGDRPNHSIMASTAASTEESGAELNRTRTSSHDVPKSKFLMGVASPLRHQARSGSTGRSVKNNNNNNNSVTTGNGAGKISSSRLPILAMGRSDSMAQYYTVVDEETRLAEALESSHALENSSHSAKKGGVGGEAYQVGVQRSTSADSDFGLLLYDEDDARHDANADAFASGEGESEYSYETEEEQEAEERRFFVFGAVTGAAKSGILDPAVASVNADSGAAGAERVVTKDKSTRSSNPKKRRPRRADAQGAAPALSAMAPNIYESVEARRARLAQKAGGGTGEGASAAARNRALDLSQPSAADGRGEADADTSPYTDATPGTSPEKSNSNNNNKKKRNPNRDSLSNYGYQSTEFSVFA